MTQVFDHQRAILLDEPEPHPFNAGSYYPLAQAVAERKILPAEHVLMALIGEEVIVLPMLDMVYRHVAQGEIGGIHWMAAFCCMCNAGSVFDAVHERTIYTFAAQGYYDVMVILADQQTQSYWNHLTGQCMAGKLAGRSLDRLGALTQMQVQDVILAYPEAKLALSEGMDAQEEAIAARWEATYRAPANPAIHEGLLATGGTLDTRLNRYDLGLGVWTPKTQRFYPIQALYEQQNVIVDRIDGRGVVIALNETVGLPFAFYYDVKSAVLENNRVTLSHNEFYQDCMLYVGGQAIRPARPNHVAIRWYGFSSIFPNCEIYPAER